MGIFKMLFGKRKAKNEKVSIVIAPMAAQEDDKSEEIGITEEPTVTLPEKKAEKEAKPSENEITPADTQEEIPAEETKNEEPANAVPSFNEPAKKAETTGTKQNGITKAKKSETKPKAEPAKAIKPVEEKEPAAEAYTGRFEIKKSKDDRYVFNLFASNHVIIATSQVYSSSSSALIGIRSVIANADHAPVEDQTLKEHETFTYPKWEIYLDKGGSYRFRLNASNGSTVCHSQGYTSKANCKNGIESIRRSVKNPEIDKAYLQKEDVAK